MTTDPKEIEVGWILIPPHVCSRSDLNVTEKIVFGLLVGKVGTQGKVTNKYISHVMSLSIRQISRILGKFTKLKLMSIVGSTNQREIKLNLGVTIDTDVYSSASLGTSMSIDKAPLPPLDPPSKVSLNNPSITPPYNPPNPRVVAHDVQPHLGVAKRVEEGKRSVVQEAVYFIEDLQNTRITNWGKQAKAWKMLTSAGYTLDQVKRVAQFMYTKDDFFSDKGFDLMTIANYIPHLKARSEKGRNVQN